MEKGSIITLLVVIILNVFIDVFKVLQLHNYDCSNDYMNLEFIVQ